MAQVDSVPSPIRASVTGESAKRSTKQRSVRIKSVDRRYFIGGSDARIIMGTDEAALTRLWQEKCGEIEPEDLSGNLLVQLGLATEDLNRRWYQTITGRVRVGLYIVAVCYATMAILLGWYPWNALLILLLFSSSKYLRLRPLDEAQATDVACRGGSCQ
jgi:hypothetical protein